MAGERERPQIPTNPSVITDYATETKQNVGNASLSSIDGKIGGSSLLGRVSSSSETSTVYNATIALIPKFALANIPAGQTDYNIVTAVAAKKIRPLKWSAVCGAIATTLTFNSKGAGAGTAISPLYANAANGGIVEGFCPVGHFETNAGEALTATTGAGSATGIMITYIEI